MGCVLGISVGKGMVRVARLWANTSVASSRRSNGLGGTKDTKLARARLVVERSWGSIDALM